MIGILDYGVGNIKAFENIYEHLNIPCKTISRVDDFESVSHIILPGVGSFDYAMTCLNESGLREKLEKLVLNEKIPVLGVCIGMQMMGNSSEEGMLKGLGWIDATSKKIPSNIMESLGQLPLPHMGWNFINAHQKTTLLEGLKGKLYFYFLHSYFLCCKDRNNVIAEVDYGVALTSIVQYGNIYGIQQHPEKSHDAGVKVLENFWSV
jgi:imidazole glycerol-phosphate synthase subunit HisH